MQEKEAIEIIQDLIQKFRFCEERTLYAIAAKERLQKSEQALMLILNNTKNYKKSLEEKDKEISKLTAESTEFESKTYELQEEIKQLKNLNYHQSKDIKKVVDINFEQNKEINDLKETIDLMSEDLTTDYHSRDWVKIYYENKVKEGNKDEK